MALKIRRGTRAELNTLTSGNGLLLGELVFVTDEQKLYIGNGVDAGGIPVTSFTAEDAVDSAGAALVAGNSTNTNITFTYGSTQDSAGLINAAVSLNLDGLSDVVISGSPTSDQVLRFNGTSWGNSLLSLNGLSDVVLGGTPIATGQFLKYDGSQWINTTTDLDSLSNVVISETPVSGAILRFNGTQWVDGLAFTNLTDLDDVTITGTPGTGSVLTYSTGQWRNSVLNLNDLNDVIVTGTPTTGSVLTFDGISWTSGNAVVSQESVEDYAAGLITRGTHTNLTVSYDDDNGTLSISVPSNTIRQIVADLLTSGTNRGISYGYVSGSSSIDSYVDLGLEEVQDITGFLFTAGTHTDISFVYEDTDSTSKINATVSIPNLRQDLSLNSFDLVGTGNINIAGSISNGSIFLNSNNLTVQGEYLNIYRENSSSTLVIRHLVPTPSNSHQTIAITSGSSSCANEIKTSRGTIETPLAVQVGDSLSFTNIQEGHDGTNYVLSSGIATYVDNEGTVSTGAVPGKIILATYADGTTPKGVVINSKGWVSINNISGTVGATLDINGFAKLAVLTAEPANLANGMVAIADGTSWNPTSTGKQTMVVRLGGSWIQMAVAP